MSLVKEYYTYHGTPSQDPAKKILFEVLGDIFGRCGFDNTWNDLDEDIQEEILQTNLKIIQKNFI